ncbi:hypothetical protein CC78DRAFT_324151 [Lojkania enalia]|uniref:Uncharacterized protein n=1 Tax=Lojkania enalia TaxID=147567 RepID=A0A9P4K388_9PLEO|nr:hypothetical protein CC78DRAFT_324151 [Didymosphaeria enalia]
MAANGPQPPPSENGLPDEERLKEAATAAQKALDAQSTAQPLKDAASSITDSKRREKLLLDAYNKEVEAHGNSKKARMLSSGAFQGATGGAGIGGAVGLGVGAIVGTLVGGLTAIPTTGLGALVGSGVGAIHGPFIKLPPVGGSKEKGQEKVVLEDKARDKESEQDAEGVVPDPVALNKAAEMVAQERARMGQSSINGEQKTTARDPVKERKKPRKLEIRSKSTQQPNEA